MRRAGSAPTRAFASRRLPRDARRKLTRRRMRDGINCLRPSTLKRPRTGHAAFRNEPHVVLRSVQGRVMFLSSRAFGVLRAASPVQRVHTHQRMRYDSFARSVQARCSSALGASCMTLRRALVENLTRVLSADSCSAEGGSMIVATVADKSMVGSNFESRPSLQMFRSVHVTRSRRC
jgi:hypothetical protein